MAFWVRGFAVVDNYIYYPDNQLSELIKMDAVSRKVVNSYTLSDEYDDETSYSDCINCYPYIIVIPWFASSIKIYDIRTEEIKSYPVKQGKNPKFRVALRWEKKVILIPFFYKEIIEIDVESGKINYHDILKNEAYRDEEVLFYSGMISQDENLLLPSFSGNEMFVYNLRNQKLNKIIIGENNTCLINITEDKSYFYVLSHYTPGFYMYDKNTKKCEYKQAFETDLSNDYFANIYDCGEYIFLAQRKADYSYIYEKNSGKFIKVDLYKKGAFTNKIIDRIKLLSENVIVLLCEEKGGMIGFWNIESRSVDWKYFDSISDVFIKKCLDKSICILEDDQCTLRLFLNNV